MNHHRYIPWEIRGRRLVDGCLVDQHVATGFGSDERSAIQWARHNEPDKTASFPTGDLRAIPDPISAGFSCAPEHATRAGVGMVSGEQQLSPSSSSLDDAKPLARLNSFSLPSRACVLLAILVSVASVCVQAGESLNFPPRQVFSVGLSAGLPSKIDGEAGIHSPVDSNGSPTLGVLREGVDGASGSRRGEFITASQVSSEGPGITFDRDLVTGGAITVLSLVVLACAGVYLNRRDAQESAQRIRFYWDRIH